MPMQARLPLRFLGRPYDQFVVIVISPFSPGAYLGGGLELEAPGDGVEACAAARLVRDAVAVQERGARVGLEGGETPGRELPRPRHGEVFQAGQFGVSQDSLNMFDVSGAWNNGLYDF
jgi:hypothetical protein